MKSEFFCLRILYYLTYLLVDNNILGLFNFFVRLIVTKWIHLLMSGHEHPVVHLTSTRMFILLHNNNLITKAPVLN